MCLIAWNWQPASQTPLVLLANRDEFYHREALPVHWWDSDQILAGRDLQAGGTWLGVNRRGHLAALTNYRDAAGARPNTPSRGELVANFLNSQTSAAQFMQTLLPVVQHYNPFNLLLYDGTALLGLESRHAKVVTMASGIGAVSNADFQTPWPKVTRLKEGLQSCLHHHATHNDALLALLHDRTVMDDTLLPRTGVPLELERMLSSTFITSPGYGTRACSVIQLHQNRAEFSEQSYNAAGLFLQQHHTFQL